MIQLNSCGDQGKVRFFKAVQYFQVPVEKEDKLVGKDGVDVAKCGWNDGKKYGEGCYINMHK